MDIPEYRDPSAVSPAAKRSMGGNGATVFPAYFNGPVLERQPVVQGPRGRTTEEDDIDIEERDILRDAKGPSPGNTLTKASGMPSRKEIDEVTACVDALETDGRQQNARLEGYTSTLSKNLQELKLMTDRMDVLHKSAKDLVLNLGAADKELVLQFSGQMGELRRLTRDLDSIESLQLRLESERTKVHEYQQRLGKIQGKVNRQKELETMWKRRASRRVRLLWGLISILVILWLLATANSDVEERGLSEPFDLTSTPASIDPPDEEL